MTTDNSKSRITIGTVTFDEASVPAPQSSRADFLYGGLACVLAVLIFGAGLFALKKCFEAGLPLAMRGVTERLHWDGGY